MSIDTGKARRALETYRPSVGQRTHFGALWTPEDELDRMTDLLTDLLHYAHEKGIDVDLAAERASEHFEEEREQVDA